jgi:hypothetical protein
MLGTALGALWEGYLATYHEAWNAACPPACTLGPIPGGWIRCNAASCYLACPHGDGLISHYKGQRDVHLPRARSWQVNASQYRKMSQSIELQSSQQDDGHQPESSSKIVRFYAHPWTQIILISLICFCLPGVRHLLPISTCSH